MDKKYGTYDFANKFNKDKIPFDLKDRGSSIRLNSAFYGLSVDTESEWIEYDSNWRLFKFVSKFNNERKMFLLLKKRLEDENKGDAVNFMMKIITAKINNHVVQANERNSHILNDSNFETLSAKVQLRDNRTKQSRKYWTIMDTRTDANKLYHKINKIINERTDIINETSNNVF